MRRSARVYRVTIPDMGTKGPKDAEPLRGWRGTKRHCEIWRPESTAGAALQVAAHSRSSGQSVAGLTPSTSSTPNQRSKYLKTDLLPPPSLAGTRQGSNVANWASWSMFMTVSADENRTRSACVVHSLVLLSPDHHESKAGVAQRRKVCNTLAAATTSLSTEGGKATRLQEHQNG